MSMASTIDVALRAESSPWPELLRVAYGPDMADLVACDIEREHRHGDAVLLAHQAGLAVDRALHDRQAECPVGEADQIARDLLVAFDRVESGGDEAAAVRDHSGVRVEQADQGADVPGFPRPLEVPDEAGPPGRRSLRRADAAAGRGGQLAAGGRGPAGGLGNLGERVAEDIVQDERDTL